MYSRFLGRVFLLSESFRKNHYPRRAAQTSFQDSKGNHDSRRARTGCRIHQVVFGGRQDAREGARKKSLGLLQWKRQDEESPSY